MRNEFDQSKIVFFDADERIARTNTSRRQIAAANLIEFWTRREDSFFPDFSIYIYQMIAEIS